MDQNVSVQHKYDILGQEYQCVIYYCTVGCEQYLLRKLIFVKGCTFFNMFLKVSRDIVEPIIFSLIPCHTNRKSTSILQSPVMVFILIYDS